MAYTTINDGSKYFQAQTYSGTGSGQSITNTGNSNLQPDWVWVKDMSDANDHKLTDSNRLNGSSQPTITLETNTTGAEYDDSGAGSDATTAFNSDGFTIGTNGNYNTDGNEYIAWQWNANGGTTTTNDASATSVGTIDSVYQANTTAGFSIVTYTGTGSNGTIAHGLGSTPEWYFVKNRSESAISGTDQSWVTYHQAMGQGAAMFLDTTDSKINNSPFWNSTAPTSTTFSVGTDSRTNTSGDNYVAYCFAPVKGYSMFGTYKSVGNNNDQVGGEFIFTGFEPSLVVVKNMDADKNWIMISDGVNPVNPVDSVFYIDAANAKVTYGSGKGADLLSTGFKIYSGDSHLSNDGDDYIYMAWGKRPLVSSTGTPVMGRRGGNG